MDLAPLLKELRLERGISRLQLADTARVNPSVVHRLKIEVTESSEDAGDLLREEAERRRERRRWRL